MGFVSGLIHAIGNGIGDAEDFFTGNKKKQQQQQQQSNNNQNNQNNKNNNNQGGGPSLQVQPVQQQQLQQSQQNQNQPVQTPNGINLTLLNNNANNQPPTANQLVKANPQPTPPPSNNQGSTNAQDTPAPAQHASILHDITHNPLTNLAGNFVKPTLQEGNALLHVPQAVYREIQNKPINDIQKSVYGTNDSGSIAKKILGDTVNTALLAVAPGADSAAVAAANAAARPAATESAIALAKLGLNQASKKALEDGGASLLTKAGAHALSNGVIGGTANAATAYGDGKSLADVGKAGLEGFGGGAVLGSLGTVAPPLLKKAGNAIIDKAGNIIEDLGNKTAAADEVATGVKSVNPTQVEDAGSQIPTPPVEPSATPVSAPTLNGARFPQVSAEAPDAVQPVMHVDDPARTQLENTANDLDTPTYMRTAAKNQLAEIQGQEEAAAKAAQEKELGVQDNPAVDSPTYQRKGIQLPSGGAPSSQVINDGLNDTATKIASDPANAPMINKAYLATGSPNPLSLVAHTLSMTPNKAEVRNIVQELIPEASGNTLNRAVNTITGADNQADVLQALHEAASEAKTPTGPLGKVSTAEAPKTVPQATPQTESSSPEPQTSQSAPTQSKGSSSPAPTEAPQRTESAPTQRPQLQTSDNIVENPSSPTSVSQETPKVNSDGKTTEKPKATTPSDGATRPNAPGIRKAVNKTLSDEAKVSDESTTSDKLGRPELNKAAEGVVKNTPQDELLSKYNGVPDLTETADLAEGKAAMPVLSKIVDDATKAGDTATANTAKRALDNLMEAVEKRISKAGDQVNYARQFYDAMPKTAKVSYTIRGLNKTLAAAGKPLIGVAADGSEDLAGKNVVESQLNKFIGNDETIKQGLSDAKDTAIKENSTNQELTDAYNKTLDLNTQRAKNSGDFADYYKSLLPKGKNWAQSLADYQRTAMLSSPTGRLDALGGTGATTLDTAIKQGVSGALGKVHNAIFTNPAKAVNDTGMNAGSLGKGAIRGGQKIKGIFQGQSYADKPDAIMNGSTARNAITELPSNSKGNVFTRLVKAATSGHQNLTMGVKDSEILRQSRTMGMQQGLKGDELDRYTLRNAINPDDNIVNQAQKVHDTINNLNKNVISDGLSAVANKTLAKIPYVGPLVKNQILPFSHFLGGNIYNTITDRNVVAAASKFAINAGKSAVGKGDTQALIDSFAKMGVEGGKTFGLGYLLSQHGVITNTDATGKNYDGTYVHIGNRFIPASSFGSFGPAIILGNAAYNAFNTHKPGSNSLIDHIASTASQAVTNAYRGYGGQDLLTGGSSLPAINQAFNSHGSGPGALSKVGANLAGAFIPAATGDVNAILNNSPLNPTHEAANTTVINTNSKSGKAKDALGSAVDSLQNKIPGLSQQLSRQPGVAAADLYDKLVKGDHATGSEIQAQNLQKSQANSVADFAANPAKVLDPLTTDSKVLKTVDAANKKSFEASGKDSEMINGLLYEKNVKGGTTVTSANDHQFQTSQGNVDPVQQAKDTEAFKQSNKQTDTINGRVYERADDGSVKSYEQKDYDYMQADTGMKQAQKAEDFTGYQKSSGDLLKNISDQLQNPNLSSKQIDALTNTAMDVQKKSAEYDYYKGFKNPDPKNIDNFKGVGQLNGAKQYSPDEVKAHNGATGYVQEIQRNAAKYNLDPNALLAVSAMEGLGGGVGDGGHAFGPFQMNDAGGVLTGKYPSSQAAKDYAESSAGIEDAINQISKVAGGLKGQAAINAIVNGFEKPADPQKEIDGASSVYNGGVANLSSDGSVSVTGSSSGSSSKAASAAAKLVKSNTIGSLTNLQRVNYGNLTPQKVSSNVPILQKVLPSDLVKQRSIGVAKVRA